MKTTWKVDEKGAIVEVEAKPNGGKSQKSKADSPDQKSQAKDGLTPKK